ncbi:MAG TPA: hypothetical protein DCR14_18195 [Acidimicrobiaceae bacterium]|nr:hypothetical protein [Acidimicrobiaceae bacterium]
MEAKGPNAAKVVGIGAMLAFAGRNRAITSAPTLRRGVAIEAGVGLCIIAVTAALVASTPA